MRPHTIWQGGVPECFNPKALEAKALAWLQGNEWCIPASHHEREVLALGLDVHPTMVAQFWRVARQLQKLRAAKNERRREYRRRARERCARALARVSAASEQPPSAALPRPAAAAAAPFIDDGTQAV